MLNVQSMMNTYLQSLQLWGIGGQEYCLSCQKNGAFGLEKYYNKVRSPIFWNHIIYTTKFFLQLPLTSKKGEKVDWHPLVLYVQHSPKRFCKFETRIHYDFAFNIV